MKLLRFMLTSLSPSVSLRNPFNRPFVRFVCFTSSYKRAHNESEIDNNWHFFFWSTKEWTTGQKNKYLNHTNSGTIETKFLELCNARAKTHTITYEDKTGQGSNQQSNPKWLRDGFCTSEWERAHDHNDLVISSILCACLHTFTFVSKAKQVLKSIKRNAKWLHCYNDDIPKWRRSYLPFAFWIAEQRHNNTRSTTVKRRWRKKTMRAHQTNDNRQQ